jgi:stearoyl-CoA desaturase (Delta-9 desaturase)
MTQVATPPAVVPAPQAQPAPESKSPPGIEILDERGFRFQRRMVLIATIIPFVGFLTAVISLWGRGISGVDFGIFMAFYVTTGLGITVGFHRLFTHRSFDAPRPLRNFFAIAGSMAVEGSVISWVAAHRRHHAFSDKEGDPHSPHLDEGEGLAGVLRGLWHAHLGWLFDREKTSVERWAPDLQKDSTMRAIDKQFPWWVVVSFAAPAVVGAVITRSLWGGVTAFIWGSLVRIFMLHHVTWSINSICHFYGRRPFRTADFSTNNWILSLISFGESWHNNHHAFPTSAIHGINKWQFDASAFVIRMMERLGLAKNVKRVSPKQLETKRV